MVLISAAGILALAFVLGMLINGCVAGLYTLAPAAYAPQSCGTGVGWANRHRTAEAAAQAGDLPLPGRRCIAGYPSAARAAR